MKKILLAAMLILLCGCTQSWNLEQRVSTELQAAAEMPAYSANISKPYYSFYLEPCVGHVDADATSDVLMLNGSRFVMNLNIPEIVNANFFTEVPAGTVKISDEPVLSLHGSLIDYSGTESSWQLNVYSLDDENYALIFSSYGAVFYSVSARAAVPELAGEMMKIARNVQIDTEKILDAYTTKDKVIYSASTIKLFESTAPVNGRIEELFENDNTAGYDETEQTDSGQTQIDTDDTGDDAGDYGITN